MDQRSCSTRLALTAGVLSVFVVLGSISCSKKSTTTPSTTTATLSGLITDASGGSPVSSATVSIQSKAATTGSDGRYSIAELTTGSAQMTVQHQGHDTTTQNVTLTAPATTANVALARALVAQLAGTWTGGWVNTTFGSNGSATMTISADTIAQTFSASLDLNGNVFGLGDPPAQSFSGPYTPAGGATINATSDLFGTLSVTVSSTGQISGTATPAPGGAITKIDLTGTAAPGGITVNYTITFVGGSKAVGALTLTKT